jgi:hypothetical protein
MLSYLGALRVTSPAAFWGELDNAIDAEGGNHTRAAARLGVTYRTLCRWLAARPGETVKKVRTRTPLSRSGGHSSPRRGGRG